MKVSIVTVNMIIYKMVKAYCIVNISRMNFVNLLAIIV